MICQKVTIRRRVYLSACGEIVKEVGDMSALQVKLVGRQCITDVKILLYVLDVRHCEHVKTKSNASLPIGCMLPRHEWAPLTTVSPSYVKRAVYCIENLLTRLVSIFGSQVILCSSSNPRTESWRTMQYMCSIFPSFYVEIHVDTY